MNGLVRKECSGPMPKADSVFERGTLRTSFLAGCAYYALPARQSDGDRIKAALNTFSENTSLNCVCVGSDGVTTYCFPHGIRQPHHRIARPE